LKIANGRQLVFKLHPNENKKRALKEIKKTAPGAIVFTEGNIDLMIANCDVLITKFSSVVYLGLALGKEVYSDFDLDELRAMVPIQNNGRSALNISKVCRIIIEGKPFNAEYLSYKFAGILDRDSSLVNEEQYLGAVSNA
jgi:hypothetical protein